MSPERWPQIEELYHSALEHDAGERISFLDRACGDDAELRCELDSLLRQEGADSRVFQLLGPRHANWLQTVVRQNVLHQEQSSGPMRLSASLVPAAWARFTVRAMCASSAWSP